MRIFVALPVLGILILCLALQARARSIRTPSCWRTSILVAAVILGVCVVLVTQVFSSLNLVASGPVLGFWLVATVVPAVVLFFRYRGLFALADLSPTRLPWFSRCLLVAVVGLSGLLAVVAILAAPNSWDSNVYHMSRIRHWIQNRDVGFFPTHILRQNHQNPGAEYLILQFQLLSGGDRLANLVQWESMVGTMIAASIIAARLGADARGQLFAAIFTFTLPMGLLQGTSSQSDYVVAFWLTVYGFFIVRAVRKPRLDWTDGATIGGALGMAVLTKATAYIIGLPFMIWLIAARPRTDRVRAWRVILGVAALALIINAGHYGRNVYLYRHMLGPMQETAELKYTNDVMTPASVVSNIARNVAIHLGTPWASLNQSLTRLILTLHKAIDADPNDLRTTWSDKEFAIRKYVFNDENDGNPAQFLLLLIAIVLIAASRRLRTSPLLVGHAVALIGAFFVFCLYLRWQPWHSRLHIPFFTLGGPLVAVAFSRLLPGGIVNAVGVVLLVFGLPWAFHNGQRAVVGDPNVFTTLRRDLYFATSMPIKEPYRHAAAYFRSIGCNQIGFCSGIEGFEYPLWQVLDETSGPGAYRLEHVNIRNASAKVEAREPFSAFRPCAIFVLDQYAGQTTMSVKGTTYVRSWAEGPVSIFTVKSETAR